MEELVHAIVNKPLPHPTMGCSFFKAPINRLESSIVRVQPTSLPQISLDCILASLPRDFLQQSRVWPVTQKLRQCKCLILPLSRLSYVVEFMMSHKYWWHCFPLVEIYQWNWTINETIHLQMPVGLQVKNVFTLPLRYELDVTLGQSFSEVKQV